MKAVILAGGLGTRISEESDHIPKPMIRIGQKPILWHIMKIYSAHDVNDFIICCGYKGYVIKEYFANYFLHMSDVTFDMKNNEMEIHHNNAEPWKVTLVDTGADTQTGGRLRRVEPYIKNEECFCFTYGDGVSDVNISQVVSLHKEKGRLATVTAVYPSGRFGAIEVGSSSAVNEFKEKPKGDGRRINAGFFVLSPKVINYIADDASIWEREPMETLVRNAEMTAYVHDGFWQPMDTLRDKRFLEKLWEEGSAPWRIWK